MEKQMNYISQYLYICQNQRRLSAKTVKAYRIDLLQFATFEDIHPNDDLRDILSTYIISMNAILKPRSVKRKIASLRAYYNYLEQENLIEYNPFYRLRVDVKTPLQLPRTIPQRVIAQMLSAAHSDLKVAKTPACKRIALRNAAVLELLFSSGMRVSELCNLNVEDIDLTDGIVRVFGKGAKERILQIGHPDVLSILQHYQSEVNSTGAFFKSRNGRRLSDQSVRNMVNRYALRVQAPLHITPHMFRHSFATLLMEENVDIRYIQQILGHSSITTTQIYTHVSMKKQREIMTQSNPRNLIAL